MSDCGGGCGSSCGPDGGEEAPAAGFVAIDALLGRGGKPANGKRNGNGGGMRPLPPPAVPGRDGDPAGFRRFTPPFRVFFTWDITYRCNYRCTYCIVFESPQWDSVLAKKDRPPVPAERWMEIWDGIYEKYGSAHIHCSGGEPFYYPRFVDILAHITGKHTMECDTNLSFDVDTFIGKVRPGTFRFAPSFHPEFAKLGPYVEKCRKLKAAGYDLEGANYICWPPHVKDIPTFKAALNDVGVGLTLIPFRGRFDGKDYPDAYTLEERRLINRNSYNPILSEDYGSYYKGANQGGENHTKRNALCRAGQMYAKIHPDGTALRCCFIDDRGIIGNLLDGTFKLYEDPMNCEFPACSCWKSMIVGEEQRWLRHWVGVSHQPAPAVR